VREKKRWRKEEKWREREEEEETSPLWAPWEWGIGHWTEVEDEGRVSHKVQPPLGFCLGSATDSKNLFIQRQRKYLRSENGS
jgi:hypothetical protein